MPRLFGTDGIRAPFGQYPLDRATVTRLGLELADELGGPDARPLVILGGDTRESTPILASWLAAGLAGGGAEPRSAGVVPTPAVARLVVHLGATAGIAISASHNLPPDNGLKLVDRLGTKWTVESEVRLESRLESRPPEPDLPPPRPLTPDPELAATYLDLLAGRVDGRRPFAGLHLVADCAHGAASALVRPLFEPLGARLDVIGDRPDGTNINRGVGSTQPETLRAEVLRRGADLGLAFDGDADRLVVVDEAGVIHDGDAILYLWATSLDDAGALPGHRIVATTMSNLGLDRALARGGIGIVRCDVGDRAVVETMRREGIVLGGEQSGHIVHSAASSTGDGLLSALAITSIRARRGLPLSHLLGSFRRFPQVLRNVRVAEKPPLEGIPAVRDAAAEVADKLGVEGRLVLRYSGTEPLARIMIEGPNQEIIEAMAGVLAQRIDSALGPSRGG